MRISDWSSDVCSSDLEDPRAVRCQADPRSPGCTACRSAVEQPDRNLAREGEGRWLRRTRRTAPAALRPRLPIRRRPGLLRTKAEIGGEITTGFGQIGRAHV